MFVFRMHDLETFEDSQLLLSALLVPWMADVASEALVDTTIPTDAFRFITSACRNSLGLPPTAPLHLRPPHMHESVHADDVTCLHRFTFSSTENDTPAAGTTEIAPGCEGQGAPASQQEGLGRTIDESAALGSTNPEALSKEAEAARPYLPLGLAWARGCATLASARLSVAEAHRGCKRTRSVDEKMAGALSQCCGVTFPLSQMDYVSSEPLSSLYTRKGSDRGNPQSAPEPLYMEISLQIDTRSL